MHKKASFSCLVYLSNKSLHGSGKRSRENEFQNLEFDDDNSKRERENQPFRLS
jgi:hypothetical protein